MIKKIILGVSLCLTLAACSEETKKEETVVPLTPQYVTNTSACYGHTPVNTNLYSNKWAAKARYNNGAFVTQVLDFNRSSLDMTIYAEFKGKAKDLSLYSRISEQEISSFRTDDTDTASGTITSGGESFYFAFSIARTTFSYSFQGPCLVFGSGASRTIFVPSRH